MRVFGNLHEAERWNVIEMTGDCKEGERFENLHKAER